MGEREWSDSSNRSSGQSRVEAINSVRPEAGWGSGWLGYVFCKLHSTSISCRSSPLYSYFTEQLNLFIGAIFVGYRLEIWKILHTLNVKEEQHRVTEKQWGSGGKTCPPSYCLPLNCYSSRIDTNCFCFGLLSIELLSG